MKKFIFLFLFLICFFALGAQTPFLGVTRHTIILEPYSNYGSGWYSPANTSYKAYGRFNILSDTVWYIQCSEAWLKVIVQGYVVKDGKEYIYNPYSGSAPDIGAFEYLESYATCSDTAFVQLVAGANGTTARAAVVAVVGNGVTGEIINIYQKGTETLEKNNPPIIHSQQITVI